MRFVVLICLFNGVLVDASKAADGYHDVIVQDGPVAYWRFDADDKCRNAVADVLHSEVRGDVVTSLGPRPSEYPDFDAENTAARFSTGPNYLVVADPGDGSPLDFDNKDALTLEAWIRFDELSGSYPYIIGKGRTHNVGTNLRNQNYSLRLATQGGGPFLSFFFCDRETPVGEGSAINDEGHRWTSTSAVPNDRAWHHVAVTYVFGDPDSVAGYIDGRPVKGKWDKGGPTDKPPFIDNDELWIGSSINGGSTFNGEIDEVAIYRSALTPEQIERHCRIDLSAAEFALGKIRDVDVPGDHVRVEIMERVPVERTWEFRMHEPEQVYQTDAFGLSALPRKYDDKGLIADRPVPWLVHLTSRIEFPDGDYRFVIRSMDAARLYIDGEIVAETPFMDQRTDGHQPLYEIPETPDGVLSVPVAHFESEASVTLDEGSHVVSVYRLVGTKKSGARVGELVVGYAREDEPLRFLAPQRDLPFDDETWLTLIDEQRTNLRDIDQASRLVASQAEQDYWGRRHEFAREQALAVVTAPALDDEIDVLNDVDRFINAELATAERPPQPLIDDFGFLRRLALDATGVIPTPQQIAQFLGDPRESRRQQAIDRFLASPGWADHWTGYWQDVLAENPGLTKPMLNNTGPFRWFIYESYLDNKPFDRFVSELISMEGSRLGGGPAGFAIASQNDVPMAAKAHILGTAFLGVQMQCARCHDAPYHDVTQGDLFSLAAMLKRGSQTVPGTSSIPLSPEELEQLTVRVSLNPGESVEPQWPFVELSGSQAGQVELPGWLLRDGDDSRERLAALITHPGNTRFARAIVNRMWQRYLGRGLIEPVDDWQDADCSHPELLDFLARELTTHDYDLKHVAGLIFRSHTYQRVSSGLHRNAAEAGLFAGPARRRLSGEQLADSLHRAVGKPLDAEELTMDADGRRSEKTFLDMGTPRRAWELVAVSNERDRPSMTLPIAQGMIDLMMAYGWRQQRQDPLTLRDETPTPLQPMVLANGSTAQRAVDMTDSSGITELALTDQPLDDFIEGLFLRVLSRPATTNERELLIELLAAGYSDRVVAGPEAVAPQRIHRSPRTWSNHLHPDATVIAMQRIDQVRAGESPSARLDADWRQRAEDAVWVLVNLPEFAFVP